MTSAPSPAAPDTLVADDLLLVAIQNDDVATVEKALGRGVSPNARFGSEGRGSTLLCCAVAVSRAFPVCGFDFDVR